MKSVRKAKEVVESVFEQYGRFIAYNPWKVVLLTVLINLLFGLCLLSRSLNNDIEELYTPRKIVTDKRIANLRPFYPDKSGTEFSAMRTLDKPFYAEVIVSKTQDENKTMNVITNEDVKTVVETVEHVAIPVRYYMADLSKVCAKWRGQCVISTSINADFEYLKSNFKIDNVINFRLRNEFVPMLPSKDSTSPVKIRFYLRHDSKAYIEDAVLWQHAFVRKFKKWDSENITVHFSHSSSFLQEVGNDSYADIRLFSLVFAIFITYSGFLISGGDCVSKRVHLGRIGVVTLPLGVLGAFGFMSGVGMTFTNVVGVMPLLLVFHEMNLVMSVLSGIGNNLDEKDGAKRVVKAVKETAVPSTAIMLVHLIPVAFASMSRYKAVETFAIYSVMMIVCNFITHFSFFIGCLTIHEIRIDENRHCCTCKEVRTRDDPEMEGVSCCFRCCCSGRPPTEREQVESFLERLPRRLFSRFLLLRPVQFALVLLLLTCAGVSVWGTMGTKAGTIQETDVTTRSYFRPFYEMNKRHFTECNVFTVSVETGEMVFVKTIENETNIDRLLTIFKRLSHIPLFSDNKDSEFWLQEFHKTSQNYTSESAFLNQVKQFLGTYENYKNDVVYDGDGDSIRRFRFYLMTNSIESWEEAIKARKMVKDLVDDLYDDLDDMFDVEARIHVPSLWLIDSYKQPLYSLAIFVSIQLGVMLLLLILFGTSVLAFIHAIFWYCFVVICALAWLNFLGLNINVVTSMYLMVGLSICAEVIMYYLFSCMYSEGMDNISRVYNVIRKTTPILYNTTFAVLLGLTILLLVKSFVFTAVLKVVGPCVAIAFALSFAFIPPTLGLVGIGKPLFFKSDAEKSLTLNISSISKSTLLDDKNFVLPTTEDIMGYDNSAFTPEVARPREFTKL